MPKLYQKFAADLKEKDFVPLKILEFLAASALFSFYPFVTIHARSIGITGSQYGVIGVLLPFCLFPVPALIGLLADKIGNFKRLLSLTFLLTGLSVLPFLALPRMETRITTVNTTLVEFKCDMVDSSSSNFRENSSTFYSEDSAVKYNQCSYDCIQIREPENDDTFQHNVCRISKSCKLTKQNGQKIVGESEIRGDYVVETEAYRYNSTHYATLADDCLDNFKIESLHNGTLEDLSCWYPCEGILSGLNSTEEEVITDYSIIAVYTICRIINSMFLAASFPLMMAAIVSILKEKNGDLGFQKIYGKLGIIALTPLVGVLIDSVSTTDNENYSPAFYMFFGLSCLSSITVLYVDLEFKRPAKALLTDMKKLLKNPEVALLIGICAIIGISYGVLDTFFFWLLEDLGADKSLMGITITVGNVAGIAISFFATKLIYKFGCADCISFSMVALVVRLLGYSMITNPWWAMPFEAMEAFTMSLLNIAVHTHGSALSTVTTLATIQTILLGTLQGMGRGMGSLIGGFMIGGIGVQSSFQVMALISAIACVVYTLINKLLIKRKVTSLNQINYNTKTKKDGADVISNGKEV